MKVFQFKIYDEKLISFLQSLPQLTEFLTELINNYKDGKLVPLENKELDTKIKKLRIEKLTDEILVLKFKIKREAIESGYSPSESLQVLKQEIQIIDTNQIMTIINKDGLCSKCNHIHLFSSKECSRWDCFCEARK